MMINDPLSDMIARIKNAATRKRSKVLTPASRLRQRVLDVLQDEGYIRGYSLVQNPGEFPHAIEHDYPMSDDAARYYKSRKGLAYRYLPFWLASLVNRAAVVLLPIVVVLIPGLRFAPYLYGWRIRRRIYKHYGELMALE